MSVLLAKCRACGCTDMDCSGCIERTGHPCYWIDANLCSACIDQKEPLKKGDRVRILGRPPGEGWPKSVMGRFGTVETIDQSWCSVKLERLPKEITDKTISSLHIRQVEKVSTQ